MVPYQGGIAGNALPPPPPGGYGGNAGSGGNALPHPQAGGDGFCGASWLAPPAGYHPLFAPGATYLAPPSGAVGGCAGSGGNGGCAGSGDNGGGPETHAAQAALVSEAIAATSGSSGSGGYSGAPTYASGSGGDDAHQRALLARMLEPDMLGQECPGCIKMRAILKDVIMANQLRYGGDTAADLGLSAGERY